MTTTWQALLWKEWRERRWLIFALTLPAMFILPVAMQRATDPVAADRLARWAGVLMAVSVASMPLVSMFLGASIAASEQSQRTITFLQSLPVRTRRAATVKLLVAMLVIWAPCLAFMLVLRFGPWDISLPAAERPFELTVATFGLACTSLLIWMAAAGVNHVDEVRAGAIGFLVITATLAIFVALMALLDLEESSRSGPLSPLLFTHPSGVANSLKGPELWEIPSAILVFALSHAALAAWYLARFGRVVRSRQIETAAMPAVKATEYRLAPPLRSPLSAILWKQMRETLPLGALGAASILSVTIVSVVSMQTGQFQLQGDVVANVFTAVWATAGFFIAIVAGIGLFIDDLRPELNGFWRSRPIDPNLWFVLKFFPALAALLFTLAFPVALVALIIALAGPYFDLEQLQLEHLVLGIAAQTFAFSLAAAAMALLRRPVVASLLTIAATFFTLGALTGSEGLILQYGEVVLAATGGVATVIAWLSVSRDWGLST